MAKKSMTKAQIVSYFAGKFELTKKTASGIIAEVAALAVSETKKTVPSPFLELENWFWSKGKLGWVAIPPQVQHLRFLPRPRSRCAW